MYCQKCRTPLKLDASLDDLNPAAYDLLVAASSQQQPKKGSATSSRPSYQQESSRKALYDKVSKNAGAPTFKRHGAGGGSGSGLRGDASTIRDAPAMSYIFLTESQVAGSSSSAGHHGPPPPVLRPPPAPVEPPPKQAAADDSSEDESAKLQEMERMNKLYEILSARSDVDHPVCVECTELLVERQSSQLEAARRDRDAYAAYLKRLHADLPSDDEVRAAEEALRKARKEERDAVDELVRLEAEKARLDAELAALEDDAADMDAEEEAFWRERNDFAGKLADFQAERDSINSRFDHDSRLLERLQRSNVYNDTFCISHDGTFATINGLRLGRGSSRPVDWPEINAAWGHALLLLVTVADKLGFRFDGFEPVPMGSTSRIVRLDVPSPVASRLAAPNNNNNNTNAAGGPSRATPPPPPPAAPKRHVLELFYAGDMPLALPFLHRKLDAAMVAFLELVRQLGAFVAHQTRNRPEPLALPYRIDGDRIGDVGIRLGMGVGADESWTKACKYALTCCKFLLAHASNESAAAAAAAAAATTGGGERDQQGGRGERR